MKNLQIFWPVIMDGNVIKELESAALLILSPPTHVSSEQRHAAEKVFTDLRKMKAPYEMCRHIMEKTQSDFVLFQTADVLKTAIITEWGYIAAEDRSALRQYLLNYLIHKDVPSFVREKLMQVVAIMIKRASLEDFGVELGQILDETEKIMHSGDVQQQILSSTIISAILQEFVITVKSDDIGLTFKDHFKAKKLIEMKDLRRIFVMILQSIEELMKIFYSSNEQHVILMRHFLFIIETIMTWGFVSPRLPKKLIGAFESIYKIEQEACLRLDRNWEGIILEPKVLELFFGLYFKIREVPELQQKGLTCLVQLSTLCGQVFGNVNETKLKYAMNYIGHFLQLLNNIYLNEREALGISSIFRKLLFYNPPKDLKDLPTNVLNSLIQQMYVITGRFCEMAAKEEQMNQEDMIYMDAFSNILEAWIAILQGKEYFYLDLFNTFVAEMFDKYLKCHLAPPEGMRASICNDEEELNDEGAKDRIRFKEQLIIIGMFGREVLDHSLPILAKLLEDKTAALCNQLQRMFSNAAPASMKISDSNYLESLFEDIHWTILISTYVVANDSDGEQNLIPAEITLYSKQQTSDITTSLKLLASPSQSIAEIPNAETSSDHVIRLVAAVFRLCEIEKSAIDAKLGQFLSPEVSSSLIWFLKIWSDSYVLPPLECYSEVSESLKQAFGQDTPGGVWTMNFILNKICHNVRNFSSEPSIIEDTIDLFVGLVKNKNKCTVIFNSEYFKSIVELKSLNLPSYSKTGLIRGLVSVAICIQEKSLQKHYIDEILQPISNRYRNIMLQPNLSQIYQNEDVKMSVISILEEIKAAFSGTTMQSADFVFNIFKDILMELYKLLELYQNYIAIVELILQLVCEAVQNVSYGDTQNMLNDSCLSIIRVYVKYNGNRFTTEKTAEDENLVDLMIILQLLNYLLAKNFIEDELVVENVPETADVVIYGLTNIMPLISIDLLKYPHLCLQYYKTITFFVDMKSHKMCVLHPDFLKQILYSIEIGLVSFGSDVQTLCLDFLQVMGDTVRTDQNPTSFMYSALSGFVKIILDLILTQQVTAENKIACGRALFSLITVFKDEYVQIVQSILQSQSDPINAERLTKEFTEMTHDFNLINSRPNQMKFLDRFDKFLTNIGFY